MSKTRKLIIYILLTLCVVGLSVGLIFAFDNSELFGTWEVFQYWLLAKIVIVLCFIGVMVYGMVEEPARGTFYPLVGLTVILQFIPMLLRAFLKLTKFRDGACMITVVATAIILIVFIGVLPFVSKKQKESDKKSEAKEIEVKQDLPDKF